MPQAYVTTSWDDGHPSDLRLGELLSRYGLTGTFYIPRSIETGVMTEAQVRGLSSNFEIGAHTLNHVFLATADDATARAEIAGSKAWVEDVTGQPCPMFCPPGGRFNSRHVPMFREAGFMGIRTVELVSLNFPRLRAGVVEMPTTLQAFPHLARNYLKNFTKRAAFANFVLYAACGPTRNWAALARKLLDRALSGGGVFHLWGHSWELDRTAQWSRVEDVFKLLGEYRSQAPCLTNGELCRRVRDSAAVGAASPSEAMAP